MSQSARVDMAHPGPVANGKACQMLGMLSREELLSCRYAASLFSWRTDKKSEKALNGKSVQARLDLTDGTFESLREIADCETFTSRMLTGNRIERTPDGQVSMVVDSPVDFGEAKSDATIDGVAIWVYSGSPVAGIVVGIVMFKSPIVVSKGFINMTLVWGSGIFCGISPDYLRPEPGHDPDLDRAIDIFLEHKYDNQTLRA